MGVKASFETVRYSTSGSTPTLLDLSAEEYHADAVAETPSLSASIAHLLCSRSPRHAWTAHPRLNPAHKREEKDRFDLGSVVHALLLEDKPIADVVVTVEATNWQTKAAQAAKKQARAEGLIPLLSDQVVAVLEMLAAISGQLEAFDGEPPLFKDGQAERTLVWEEDGVTCRARLDWIRDDLTAVDDLKTTSASADPARWTRTLFQIGADVQTAFYLRGLRAVTGAEPTLRYVVAETYAPYAISTLSLGKDVLAIGDAKVDYALEVWKRCLKSDRWDAYPQKLCVAELPAFEESRWLEKTTREAEAA